MQTQPTAQKIVIVEDNASLADIYKIRLEILGYICFAAYDGREALAVIERELPDLVLLDLMVPKVAGDQILEIMRASSWGKDTKVLIISNLNEADAPAGLRAKGIVGYAVKANLSNDQLDQLVDNILKPSDQEEAVDLESPENMVTHSPTPTIIDTRQDLVVSRTFQASLAEVWRAWTEPQLLRQWWGPDQFTCPSATLNVYVGGLSVVAMSAPAEFGGQTTYSSWAHTQVVPQERLEFIHNLCDEAGRKIDPTSVGLPADFPQAIHYEIVFKPAGKSAELVVTEHSWPAGQLREMSRLGMEQSLEKLAKILQAAAAV